MPTPTYDLIDSTVLGSSAASVTFSSIPATYRDLVLVVSTIAVSASLQVEIELNDDTATNYFQVRMVGDGSSATSAANSREAFTLTPAASIFEESFMGILQIMDYSATDKHKTALGRGNLPAQRVIANASRWANTAAVNKLKIYTIANTYPAGSSFYLYGIVS
jgi:hypothetical protein